MTRRIRIVFFWNQFAPYHIDRVAAAAEALGADVRVAAIEVARASARYPWTPSRGGERFEHLVLAPDRPREAVGPARRLMALLRALGRLRPTHAFLCHYNQPEVLIAAWLLRLTGARVHVMADSKFDDKPRHLWRELAKRLWMGPYHGALVAGGRSRDYVRLLGIREDRIAEGYDTLSVARVRAQAGAAPAPEGCPHADRHFAVVARFVEKKNLPTAIAAYARYRELVEGDGGTPRTLVLCGDGPQRDGLAESVARRGLAGVRFAGFVQAPEIAATLARSLALLLPSTEEQWGLVVNEAFALGVPVLASARVGAADGLLRAGVNGFLFDPFEVEGMARVMRDLDGDREGWRRLAAGARDSAAAGDVARFVDGVRQLVDAGRRAP